MRPGRQDQRPRYPSQESCLLRDYVSPHHCYRTDGNWFLMKFKRYVPTACGVRFARQNQYPIRLIIAPIPIRIHWALKQTTVAILAAPACRLNEIPTSNISHLLVGFESVGSAAIKICQGFSRKKGVVLSGLSRRYIGIDVSPVTVLWIHEHALEPVC